MFEGFTDRTFEFYMAIRFNNNREFFTANRAWYEDCVKRPFAELVDALTPVVQEVDDAIDVRAGRCLSRIYRDMRHAHGQPPYRDYSFLKFCPLGESRHTMLALYFDLSDAGASYGMGIYEKNLPMMNALRQAIMTQSSRVQRLVRKAEASFVLYPNTIVRMPVPDAVPDALKPWYTLRSFHMEKALKDFALLKSPALVDELIAGYRTLKPLYQFIQGLAPIEGIV